MIETSKTNPSLHDQPLDVSDVVTNIDIPSDEEPPLTEQSTNDKGNESHTPKIETPQFNSEASSSTMGEDTAVRKKGKISF